VTRRRDLRCVDGDGVAVTALLRALDDALSLIASRVELWTTLRRWRDFLAASASGSEEELVKKARSIHWSPYGRVGVVNADP
jgi:hypothetical protein